MNIRTKLFIFLPIFVIILNLISFSIYQTSVNVQDSYQVMMKRILLYKEVSAQTDQTLHSIGNYLIRHDEKDEKKVLQHLNHLNSLTKELETLQVTHIYNIELKNYYNEIQTFIEKSRNLYTFLKSEKSPAIISGYQEVEQLGTFIKQDAQSLVDQELAFYQPIFDNIQKPNEQMRIYGLLLFFTSTLLSISFALWLSQSISLPVKTLINISEQIGQGNFNLTLPQPTTKDELGQLSISVHTMYEDLKKLIKNNIEVLERDRLVKELELKALQSQINPHFLYNTLNIVSKLAYIEGADKTSELAVSTSNLLRYNLQDLRHTVTLKDEFAHAKEYFTIQQTRFSDRLTFTIHLDERIMNQKIPCLTIQPLLENAFIHGIECLEHGGHITLSAILKSNSVYLVIADNGVGMTNDVKDALNMYLTDHVQTIFPTKGHVTGIGTTNVLKRLHLFYGKKLKLQIDNTKGTKLAFYMPLNLEELNT